MPRFNLRQAAFNVLSSAPETKFTARDIALRVAQEHPTVLAEKQARGDFTNESEVINQWVSEISGKRPLWQNRHSQLRTTEGSRPRLYYWSTKTEAEEVAAVEAVDISPPSDLPPMIDDPICADFGNRAGARRTEHDLYPLLINFLAAEHGVQGVRIDEKRSSNRYGAGGNRWLFPDVVGMENLTTGMHEEIVTAMRESGDKRIRLWSFEAKLLINRSNARETYFQAVSNSSWANFGYLVAERIEGTDTLKELQILYGMHGIGLLQLNSEDPTESQILIPARERPDVEWPMCSRLAHENPDFRDFMRRVRQFFQTGDM